LVAKLPKLKVALVVSAALATILVAARNIWQTINGPQSELFGNDWFQATVKRFQFTQQEWLPSSWLSNGLLEAARPWTDGEATAGGFELPVVQSCLYLTLLIANAMLLHLLVVWAGRHWLRDGMNALSDRQTRRTNQRVALVDRFAGALLSPFPVPVRLLLIKDWQLLRRDPAQWLQFMIFFGLLGLYFLNIDRFSNPINDINYIAWVNLVSFLNLAVVGLILSTFTTRFIYPMISLEGQRFWVLGLLPIERKTILWSKFVFAALGSWVPCGLLILISDLMLQIDMIVVLVHQFTCLLLCLGLASIAVGLGAMMPDFRETSPSKIAAGFGGTLNLVLSAVYIIVIIVLTALPCHFYLIADKTPWRNRWINPENVGFWLAGGLLASAAVGLVACIVPLRQGLRAFSKVELH
jgi:ABC-2 type transport system permease protein